MVDMTDQGNFFSQFITHNGLEWPATAAAQTLDPIYGPLLLHWKKNAWVQLPTIFR